jgi:hypothetical protein
VVEAHQREEVRHNEGGKKERQKRREVVVHVFARDIARIL